MNERLKRKKNEKIVKVNFYIFRSFNAFQRKKNDFGGKKRPKLSRALANDLQRKLLFNY
jgi:hypothetical protein